MTLLSERVESNETNANKVSYKASYEAPLTTLASGIDVGPMFINFGFFSRPYGLIREYRKVI